VNCETAFSCKQAIVYVSWFCFLADVHNPMDIDIQLIVDFPLSAAVTELFGIDIY
jgi:hypothetical protein